MSTTEASRDHSNAKQTRPRKAKLEVPTLSGKRAFRQPFDGGLSNHDRDESSDGGVVWGQGAGTVDYLLADTDAAIAK